MYKNIEKLLSHCSIFPVVDLQASYNTNDIYQPLRSGRILHKVNF